MRAAEERSPKTIRALAAYLHELRPGWDETALRNALARASEKRLWREVEQVALRLVRSDKALSPAAVEFPEQYRETPGDLPVVARRCPRCSRWRVPNDGHTCQPGDHQRGALLARAALHPGKD